jgi:DNA-binding transcriptional LysR family regulator
MEMHQVRYFLAIADTLNVTRAAERCHVSQPASTRAIQQLKEEMGGLLLRRERKLTHLTDFGLLIEPHLRQLSADAEAAKSTAKKFLTCKRHRSGWGSCAQSDRRGSWGFSPDFTWRIRAVS